MKRPITYDTYFICPILGELPQIFKQEITTADQACNYRTTAIHRTSYSTDIVKITK